MITWFSCSPFHRWDQHLSFVLPKWLNVASHWLSNSTHYEEHMLPWGLSGTEPACQWRRCRFNPWVRKIPWRRKCQPTPVLLPGKPHGPRSLAGYSPWCRLPSMGSPTVRHIWVTALSGLFFFLFLVKMLKILTVKCFLLIWGASRIAPVISRSIWTGTNKDGFTENH